MPEFETFRALHQPGQPLALANAWDVASATIVAAAGAKAIATTSAGVAWSLGAPDGNRLDRDQALALIARIAAAVDIPVSADIEGGFASGLADLTATCQAVIDAGAAGINLEDAATSGSDPLLPIGAAAERVATARAADPGLFINARIDCYLGRTGDAAAMLADTLARAAAYRAAGADGIFVPGVIDAATIATLVAGVDAPLNILAGPGAPSLPALASLGVARVSLGSSVAQTAYGVVRRVATEFFTAGTYESIKEPLTYGELNQLVS